MTGFKYSSAYSKVALLVATTNALFSLCGFVSSFWQIGTEDGLTVGYGLWFRCVDQPVVENDTTTELRCTTFNEFAGQGDKYDSSLQAVRGLRFTAFICLCYTAWMGFFYIYADKFHRRRTVFFLTVFAFATVILGIAGLIVYGSSLVLPGFSLSWSFVVAVLTTIFAVPIAVMFTIELIQFGKRKSIVDDVQVEASKQDSRVHPSKENANIESNNRGAEGVSGKRSEASEMRKNEKEKGAAEKRDTLSVAENRGSTLRKQVDNAESGILGSALEPSQRDPVVQRQSSLVEPRRKGSVVKPRRHDSTKEPDEKGTKETKDTHGDSTA